MNAIATPQFPLAAPDEVGLLGVFQLKRLWSRATAARRGAQLGRNLEWHLDKLVIHALGLGLEQASQYLMQRGPGFEEFEQWILATTGGVASGQIERINALIAGAPMPEATRRRIAAIEASAPVLSAADLEDWERDGYVILRSAVSPEESAAAAQAVWDHLNARADDPDSWYRQRNNGVMVQYFQHPAFTATRASARIHKAFAQLWGSADLWTTTDRCGFNVPERDGWRFPGPDLHWDVSIAQPIPFGTQGILYLTDTLPEQGALTVVPGFQHRVGEWLKSLPAGADPRQQNMHALGPRALGANAGDLIIWHQALPHGASPNRASVPRLVQYIDMYPARVEINDTWL